MAGGDHLWFAERGPDELVCRIPAEYIGLCCSTKLPKPRNGLSVGDSMIALD